MGHKVCIYQSCFTNVILSLSKLNPPILSYLKKVGEPLSIVLVNHSINIVNLFNIGVVVLKVGSKAVWVLLLDMVGPTLAVVNVALSIAMLTDIPTFQNS